MADQLKDINLQEVQDLLVDIAFEAGRMMLAANIHSLETDTKMNSVDIVTECDKAVETLVSTRLRAAYPTFLFVGEETYQQGVTRVTDAPTFICDPIDGTINFVHGVPWCCISLGLAVGRKPAVGVVYNPFLDVLYTGARGAGAFMQRNASRPDEAAGRGPKLQLPLGGKPGRPLKGVANALVCVEAGSLRDGPNWEAKLRVYRHLAAAPVEGQPQAGATAQAGGGTMCQSVRAMGSAALNLCAVAAGMFDAYWEGGVYAWDVAAGWCIIEEAGALMVSGNPGEQGNGGWEADIESRVYLAVRAASEGQRELVEEFWGVVRAENGRLEYKH